MVQKLLMVALCTLLLTQPASAQPSFGAEDVNAYVRDSSSNLIDPAEEHITAGSPHACRLSDGTSFYDALTETTFSATDFATSANQLPPSSIGDGAKTVSSAGTAETLVASSTPCKYVLITAEDDNSGKIYYGGSGVSSSSGGYLFPAQTTLIEIDNVQKVYIDADTSTDGVKFTYAN